MSNTEHIASIFLAFSLIDGPLRLAERELMFGCLQGWQGDLDRAGYLALLRRVGGPLQGASPAVLHSAALTHAEALRPAIRKSRKRAVMLMVHLCRLGEADGVLGEREQALLLAVRDALGLKKRIAVDIQSGQASLSYVPRAA